MKAACASTRKSRRSFLKLLTASSTVIVFPSIVRAQTLGLGGGIAPRNRVAIGSLGVGLQGTGLLNNLFNRPSA
ncbi:MAG: hypothetical protein HY736_25595 [Verrucomicrobia bacterium]|nr:hypothetical protein [Verrucomicrobiota bacterium]